MSWTCADLKGDPDAALFWACQRCERPNFVATEPRCGQCGRPPASTEDRLRCALAGAMVRADLLRGLAQRLREARVVRDERAAEAMEPQLRELARALREALQETHGAILALHVGAAA